MKFKETEIGKIPEDWEVSQLKNVCLLKSGSVFSKDIQGNTQGKYPFIKVSDMNLPENALYIKTANNWIDENIVHSNKATIHPKGAVVFAKIGIALTYNRRRMLVRETIIDNNMMSAIPKEDAIEPSFLYYLLSTVDFNKISSGSALPYLNSGDIYSIKIPLPSLSEQRVIAKILSDLDAKIDLNNQMNKTLEEMSSAIFKHWFVDFEFPNDKGKPYKSSGGKMVDSELEDIPDGWSVKPLDNIANFLNGLALQKYPPRGENDLAIIKIRELNKGIVDGCDYANNAVPNEFIVDDGDMLFSWSGSLDIKIWCGGRGALNQHLFKVNSDVCPKWFYYHSTKSHLTDFQQIAAGKATTMGHIQRRHLTAALVSVPPANIMQKADRFISPLMEQFISNSIENRELSSIRDSLLPKLMSGKIRATIKGA